MLYLTSFLSAIRTCQSAAADWKARRDPGWLSKQDASDHEKVTTIKNVCNFSPECLAWAKWRWQGLWWLSSLSRHNNPSNRSPPHSLMAANFIGSANFWSHKFCNSRNVMYWCAKWYVKTWQVYPAILTLWSIPPSNYSWWLISMFLILMKYVVI